MKPFHFFLFLVFFAKISFALDLHEVKESLLVPPEEVYFLEDSIGEQTFYDVRTNCVFKTQSTFPSVKNTNANYWIKIDVTPDYKRKWVIEVITPQTENVVFYSYRNGKYVEYNTGHLHPTASREYQHKNFVFNLEFAPNHHEVYFKIRSKNKVGFLFKIHSQEHFTAYSLGEYWFLGFYYGLLVLLVIYHLVFFIYLRNPLYLFYCLTVVFAGLTSMSDDGLGIMYVWNSVPQWSQSIGLYVLPIAFIIAFSFYAYFFLGNRFRAFQKLILYGLGTYLIAFIFQLIFSSEKVYFSGFYSIPFVFYYAIFLYVAIRYKHKPSIFFAVGYSFSLLGIIVSQLRLLGYLEGSVFTVYAFNVGVVLEFLTLALSISYKMRHDGLQKKKNQERRLAILKEKNEAQRKLVEVTAEKERITSEINKDLEIKVQERTSQLSDLIEKLRSLNLDYDKENWELKRSVRSEKHSKLVQENLSLKELFQLYPTNYKCWEYLSELKWGGIQDYTCFRCGHDNYSVNSKNFSRKCSRCSTAHSVTKDSLFHAQKIPLNKLFYITYLWNSSEDINVKVLSDDLDISETSLYKFLAKLKAKKDLKKKQKIAVKSWVDLIF